MEEANLAKLQERTGRTLEQWIRLVQNSGADTEKTRIARLKEEGVTTNYALWIAKRAAGGGTAEHYDPDALVKEMFAGKRAGLLPIYQALLRLGFSLGKDVGVSPGKTIVPFYRNHVFAHVKPATNTRIDFGFALGDKKPAGRLLSTGGFEKGDRITHRIPMTSLGEIDAEVEKCLKRAYEMDV